MSTLRESRREREHYRERRRSRSPDSTTDAIRDKQRRRKHDSSSDSESDSAVKRADKRKKKKREKNTDNYRRKREKELMKALETPEEKRARRLAKKEAKRRKQLGKYGWDQNDLEYTNADNPFGDKALFNKFTWHKKRENEAKELRINEKQLDKLEQKRREEMKKELEKVKKRRQERETERTARQLEMENLQRLREAEMFSKWEKEEDTFHLEQAKLRSKFRVEAGRAKPIDLLAKYITSTEKLDDMDIETQEPYLLLMGLNQLDLEDLLVDIADYIEVEQGRNQDFWKDMRIVCEDELQKLRKMDKDDADQEGDRRQGIHTSVTGEVTTLLKEKTHGQLVALQDQIQMKLNSGDAVDVGYWESLLIQLKAHMARARLKDKHQSMLQRKLLQLKQEQEEMMSIEQSYSIFPSADVKTEPPDYSEQDQPGPSSTEAAEERPSSPQQEQEPDSVLDEEELLQQAQDEYIKGCYSPKLLRPTDVEEELIVDPKEDAMQLFASRAQVKAGGKLDLSSTSSFETSGRQLVQSKGEDGFAEDEYNFNSEIQLLTKSYIWQDKYKPRKPRFFNRVHTGYEWNKYNQTHYDHDNPPPKIVQGYKFNIFYPDLINKRKTPEFFLEPLKGSDDFATLRFHAGPPYEDIAFKIVNREWECSWKKGFKCQFTNNIFQLWFRFKRNRYRR